ncbi:MAG: RluA family pseudouridine synthase [Bacteroidetes bacterium]|nr:RluA family pseudouridine synthase [Bacteroidota bacterium]
MNYEEVKNRILFEDNHLIAFNKPAGILVQPNPEGEESLEIILKEFLKLRDQKPSNVYLGVIHRLDRNVSGLVIFAKTSKALARMNELFKSREMKKTYYAIVKNKPKQSEGKIESYLLKDSKNNISKSFSNSVKGSKLSQTMYRLICASESYFLLEITPLTGRHHQIRLHLSEIGIPIAGDLKYGAARSNKDGGISLHSKSLEFLHPVKKEMIKIDCPMPNYGIWQYFS